MKSDRWALPSGVPIVQGRVTLLSELDNGRQRPVSEGYMPHIVIGPESQRVALRDGNTSTEHYLGVRFVGGPEELKPGESGEVNLALMYFPAEDYKEVLPGATFTIREGPHVVGFGTILSRPQ